LSIGLHISLSNGDLPDSLLVLLVTRDEGHIVVSSRESLLTGMKRVYDGGRIVWMVIVLIKN